MLGSMPGMACAQSREAAIRATLVDPDHSVAPGCVAGVFQNGNLRQSAASGFADLASQRPLDTTTLFYGASLSKQFTALAAATLIAQGKLGLEDNVRSYLPELPAYARPVTVEMLMHHTSGIRDSLGLLRLAGMADVGRASKEQTLDLLFRQTDTAFVPGTQYSYSNGGYLLLAEIVARVSGQPFAQYARQVLFDPMGMKHAYFLDDGSPRPGTFAHGYVPEGDAFAARDTFPRFSGSGGLMLSLEDLARYERDIEHRHRVWTEAVAKIMLTPGRLADGTPIDDGKGLAYGGGLHMGRLGGESIVRHGGSAEAFKHAYVRLPERHAAFAVLCNRGDWKAAEKLDEVMAAAGTSPPGYPRTYPSGRFHSKELDSDYTLVREGSALLARITSPLVAAPRTVRFEPGEDGAFHAGAMSLWPGTSPDKISVSRGQSGRIPLTRRTGLEVP